MTKIGDIYTEIQKKSLCFAVLEEREHFSRIFVSLRDKDKVSRIFEDNSWNKLKETPRESYLYGMEHFCYYESHGEKITVVFQLACRSTLNSAWVPLDRKINLTAIERITLDSNGIPRLCAEDELCYFLAKCVYTDKTFDLQDIKRIESCFAKSDINQLMPKIESVFFRFSQKMLEMVQNKEYDHIINALWAFAEY